VGEVRRVRVSSGGSLYTAESWATGLDGPVGPFRFCREPKYRPTARKDLLQNTSNAFDYLNIENDFQLKHYQIQSLITFEIHNFHIASLSNRVSLQKLNFKFETINFSLTKVIEIRNGSTTKLHKFSRRKTFILVI
jgi:hypothetical protein